MRYLTLLSSLTLTALLFTVGCGDSDADTEDTPTVSDADIQPVLNQYATIVHRSYDDALKATEALSMALTAFTAEPLPATHLAAKQAWLEARDIYGQTEGYRFYDGPIDGADGPEGQINAWPLDENYIDYTEGDPDAGIIQDASLTLTRELLVSLNEQDGEANISTGYHAIEFLLWGQDLSATGPGERSHTDFVDGARDHAERRRVYLSLVTELLVDDLREVTTAWAPDADNYRSTFLADAPRTSLVRILNGMGSLSGAELAGERMEVALENRDQEDEHSCFSDNTHRDIYANALSIQNIYLGRFADLDGPGVDELVRAVDPALDDKMKTQLARSVALAQQMPTPFDQALVDDAGRAHIQETIDALREQTETIVEIATALGVTLNLE